MFFAHLFLVMLRFTQWTFFHIWYKMRYFPIRLRYCFGRTYRQTDKIELIQLISFLKPVWLRRPENHTAKCVICCLCWACDNLVSITKLRCKLHSVSCDQVTNNTCNEMTDPLSGTTLVHGFRWHVCCLLTGAASLLLKPLYSIINKRPFWAPMNRQTLAQLWS